MYSTIGALPYLTIFPWLRDMTMRDEKREDITDLRSKYHYNAFHPTQCEPRFIIHDTSDRPKKLVYI